MKIAGIIITLLLLSPATEIFAQGRVSSIDFGDDGSNWAHDGECDDPRFAGEGSATTLVESDRLHDASDCRALFLAGSIYLAADNSPSGDLGVDFGDNSSIWAFDGQCDDQRFAGRGMSDLLLDTDMFHDADDCRKLFESDSIRLLPGSNVVLGGRFERGRLRAGDATRDNGSYSDSYTFVADRGDAVFVDLRSGEFDTFLTVRAPNGEVFSNDDYEASFDRSLVSIPRTETGFYEAIVSSHGAGEVGGYTLEITRDERPLEPLTQQISGILIEGDSVFTDGEYYDSYEFEGRPGQALTLDLRSDDFDAYLIIRQPDGAALSDDDSEGSNSRIETVLSEAGSYEVVVSSYAAGETGEYRLSIEETSAQDAGTRIEAPIRILQAGVSHAGELADGDQLPTGESTYQDSYFYIGVAGETVLIDLNSIDFDTVLGLLTPTGELIENDDFRGSTDQSQIRLTLQTSGRYRILVSAYGSDETGDYQIAVRSIDDSSPGRTLANPDPQLYGVFAGIAVYPGMENDLAPSDQDAIRVRDALNQGAGMDVAKAHTLLNSDATRTNFRSALAAIDDEIGDDDTLVIFFSGRGDRVPSASGPNGAEPDGLDETIEFYDGALLDDELATLLDSSGAGTILLVLDARYGAGFSKDILSRQGRMGLFSSPENLSTQLAFKYRRGAYLSTFLDEAIRQGLADRDENDELTAMEIIQYLQSRYRNAQKSTEDSSPVRASGPQSAHQQLNVDTGGVGAHSVLFEIN